MTKTEHLTVRISSDLKNKLRKSAEKHKWSLSFTICEILENHFKKYELSGDLR